MDGKANTLDASNPVGAPIYILASPLPVKLPLNGLGKAVENGLYVWVPHPHRDLDEAPNFILAQPWPLKLSLLCLSLSLEL